MAVTVPTLESIVQMYLSDTAFHDEQRTIADKRNASIAPIRAIILRFINGYATLAQFCDELKVLYKMQEWGASGPDFLMEMNKLNIHHTNQGETNDVETHLRLLLTGLNRNTVGQRIEQFATFLGQEQQRLTQLGQESRVIVSPGTSAFIISLLAFWLDEGRGPYIYY